MLSTVSALGAQNIGAGKQKRAEQTMWCAALITVVFGLIVVITIQFISVPVVGLFTTDAEVARLGGQYIRGYIWDCIFAGVHFTFSGYFCACGRSEFSFLHNIIAILLVRIPGVYLTSIWFPDTLFPMGIATACGSLTSLIICLLVFRYLKEENRFVLLHKFSLEISYDRRSQEITLIRQRNDKRSGKICNGDPNPDSTFGFF